MAAMMIMPMGQMAVMTPSRVAVRDSPMVRPVRVSLMLAVLKITLSTIEMASAIRQPI